MLVKGLLISMICLTMTIIDRSKRVRIKIIPPGEDTLTSHGYYHLQGKLEYCLRANRKKLKFVFCILNKWFLFLLNKQTNKKEREREKRKKKLMCIFNCLDDIANISFHCFRQLVFFFLLYVNSGMRISDTHDVRVIKINHLKGLNAPIVVVV